MSRPIASLFSVPFFTGTAQEALGEIMDHVTGPTKAEPFLVFTPNTEQLMLSRTNAQFLEALQHSSMNLPDSAGVIWAARQLGVTPFSRRRIAGREMLELLLPKLAAEKKKVMFLGGKRDIAHLALQTAEKMYPGFEGAAHAGAENISTESQKEQDRALQAIEAAHPDILFIAYGAPYQELWALRHAQKLAKAGVKVVMVVGGAFDQLAGVLPSAPQAIGALGLEWLWRLILEPRRMKRQLALPQFVLQVMKEKFS